MVSWVCGPERSRGAAMAQVKEAGDAAARSQQVGAELYSVMAAVGSSPGESVIVLLLILLIKYTV